MAATPPSVRLAPPVAPDVLDTEDEVELELALDAAELSTEVVPEEDAPVDAAELTAEAAEEASVTPLPSAAQFVVYSAHEQALQRRQIAGTSARPVGIAPPSPTSLNGSDVSSDAEEGCAFSDEEPNFDPYRFDSDDEAPAAPSSSKLSPALTLRRRPRSPSPSPAPSSQEEQLASSQRSFRDHTPPSNPLRRYSRGGRPFREMAPSPETPSRAELIRRGDVVVGCLMEGGKRRRVE